MGPFEDFRLESERRASSDEQDAPGVRREAAQDPAGDAGLPPLPAWTPPPPGSKPQTETAPQPDAEATVSAGAFVLGQAKQIADLRAEAERLRGDATEVLTDNADLKSEQTELHAEIVRLEAEAAELRGERDALRTAASELLEVADLRGDAALPHPEDDPKLWTARMQTAWDELRAALGKVKP